MTRHLAAIALVAGTAIVPHALAATPANDYPTQARVEFVLACMDRNGGQSYNTLYPCVCMIDGIADGVTYQEYVEAETLGFLWSTPGERGGVFRDAAPNSRARIKQLGALLEQVRSACFVSN